MNRKKRTIAIRMDPRNYFEFDGLSMDFATQKLMGVKDGSYFPLIGEAQLELLRERENKKGPKVLHSSSSPNNDIWFSTDLQLLAYDHLIAVDTNTNHINGSTVSITAAYHVIPEKHELEKVQCKATVLALIEFWNVAEKQENLGWYQVLQAISESLTGKIGLIVDSDLGSHKLFNKRQLPIFGDYYLPKNVTIIYSSDKGGAEQLSTKMIKYCHDLAADLYKEKKLLLNTEGLHAVSGEMFSHVRQWNTNSMKLRPFCDAVKD